MSAASLTRALPAGERILLDSTTLIAYLDGGEQVSEAATLVVDDLVRSGRNPAVISMVTVLEVLVKPARRSHTGYRHAHDFLQHFPNFSLQQVDFAVAQEAAGIRATYGMRTPDALIIATGVIARAAHLVCNDDMWRRVQDKRVRPVVLRDHIPI